MSKGDRTILFGLNSNFTIITNVFNQKKEHDELIFTTLFDIFDKEFFKKYKLIWLSKHLLPLFPNMEYSRPIGPLLLRSVDAFETFYLCPRSPDSSLEPW